MDSGQTARCVLCGSDTSAPRCAGACSSSRATQEESMREDGIVGAPRRVVVVGAGVVGLSTAWFLQEHGVEVTVVDRRDVASGASWGNAGYVAPGFSVPLPEPAVLRYGLRALLDRDAPLSVPASPDLGLWSFLLRFAAHCTTRSWSRSMRALAAVNEEALEAFDALRGVAEPPRPTTVTVAFEQAADADGLRREFEMMRRCGQDVDVTEPPVSTVEVPQLSARIGAVLRVAGQRFVAPGEFTRALADAVVARGGTIRRGFDVVGLSPGTGGAGRPGGRAAGDVVVKSRDGHRMSADEVVLATGAWLSRLAGPLGVRVPVRAGRGYSFTVPTREPVPGPIYLPGVRVACTPYQDGLRVAGTMEFRDPDAPVDTRRIEAIVRSARPLLSGVRWDERSDEWGGPRPVTPDGLPLVGRTRMAGVHVAGGHGMWGLTLGPVTGRLLAERIATGKTPDALRPFDPLR
ncbi:NAD(P)/FAD-dependent oxidoreductase [Saccharopolyspora rosea]|uniref:NAD(P)/FAD-dependent oxidoreductase n=1 Tax=Saccharopolyspora rosea TaxID=524884 RepID=UPI0037CAAC7F